MVCKATGLPVVMEYEGEKYRESDPPNGHPCWLCLHNDNPEEDAEEVKAFTSAEDGNLKKEDKR